MMTDDVEYLRITLAALTRRLRWVRACSAASRLLVVGLLLSLLPLLLKRLVPAAPLLALCLAGIPAALGFLYGGLARLSSARVARLADGRLQLQERLTSAEEHLLGPPAADMVRAQLAETAQRMRRVRPRDVFRLLPPPETRWIPPLAALALALALLPPLRIPLPTAREASKRPDAAATPEEAERPLEQKLAPPAAPRNLFPRGRERSARQGPLAGRNQPGDLSAIFKDTKLSQERPDFGSFVKQGDDRLKLLARPDSLPDLSRDFTQNPYQVMVNRMQQALRAGRLQGLTWDQIQRLLSQMGQSQQGQGASGLPDELAKEMGDQGGSTDKMLSALSRALNRLRDKAEAGQGQGKSLKEAPAGDQTASRGEGDGQQGGQEPGTGGSLPGTEKSLQTRGEPTPRIPGQKQDSTLDGELRPGQTEAYNTNLSGGGAQNPSRLPYMDVFSQYRKAMEETLTKEPIPFNYREQVKEYFQSLESH